MFLLFEAAADVVQHGAVVALVQHTTFDIEKREKRDEKNVFSVLFWKLERVLRTSLAKATMW